MVNHLFENIYLKVFLYHFFPFFFLPFFFGLGNGLTNNPSLQDGISLFPGYHSISPGITIALSNTYIYT
jgi:hypothetical protein